MDKIIEEFNVNIIKEGSFFVAVITFKDGTELVTQGNDILNCYNMIADILKIRCEDDNTSSENHSPTSSEDMETELNNSSEYDVSKLPSSGDTLSEQNQSQQENKEESGNTSPSPPPRNVDEPLEGGCDGDSLAPVDIKLSESSEVKHE